MDDGLENLRKKLIFRSWHRGTREMDLIMGRFAEAHVPGFDEAQLAEYEDILGHPDPDLYEWFSGKTAVPANYRNATLEAFVGFDIAN